MNKRLKRQICLELGLSAGKEICHGVYNDNKYLVSVMPYTGCMVVAVFGRCFDDADTCADKLGRFQAELLQSHLVQKCVYERYALRMAIESEDVSQLKDVLDKTCDFFSENGYKVACCCCGEDVDELSLFEVNGKRDFICKECYNIICEDIRNKKVFVGNEKSNAFTGFFGALAGIHLGILVWLLLSGVGFSSALPAMFMMMWLCFGYQKMGGCIDGKGVVICVLLAILYFPVGEYLGMAHWVYTVYNDASAVNYIDAFMAVPFIVGDSQATMIQYVIEVLISIFFALAALTACLVYYYKCNKKGIVFKEL